MKEFQSIPDLIARYAQECGFERERFVDVKLPSDFDKVVVILFFGDFKALALASMFLLKPFCENVLKDRYVIFCSYPGMGGLFPWVDEYWHIADELSVSDLLTKSSGFVNNTSKVELLEKQFRRRFFTVLTNENFSLYYDKGFTTTFFDNFKKIDRYFPSVVNWRGETDMAMRGKDSVFLFPVTEGKCWDRGKEVSLKFPKEFWIKLTERFLDKNFLPIIYQNQITFDISSNFGERCFYCTDRNFLSVLSAMRATGCVLDVFSGISRMALIARCPFIFMDERQRYVQSKEFEINDLSIAGEYPYRYIFSFPTVISSGNYFEIIDQLVNVSVDFISANKKIDLPFGGESCKQISYDIVREHKARKLGIHFIKIERLVI